MQYITQVITDKNKDAKTARLRFRIKWANSSYILNFSIGYTVDLAKWSKDAQRCKHGTTHSDKKIPANIINREIEKYEANAHALFSSYAMRNYTPTIEEVKIELNERIRGLKIEAPKEEINIIDLSRIFLTKYTNERNLSLASIKNYNTLFSSIDSTLTLDQFNNDWIMAYIFEYKKKEKPNTSKLRIILLKTFIRWLIKQDYPVKIDLDKISIRIKTIPKKIIFLTWDELMQVYNLHIEKTDIKETRDSFCFSAFTGLRISDIKNLKWANIKNDTIYISTIKNRKTIAIELNNYSRAILLNQEKKTDLVFPLIHKMQDIDRTKRTRAIMKEAKIDTPTTIEYYRGSERIEETKPKYEYITSHVARKTFISNAIMLGIDPHVVMKWTGHSNYSTMKPYIDISDELKAKSMDKFNI